MNITQIEDSLKTIVKSLNKVSFIYEFLLAYGLPKASITRLKKGNLNLSKVDGDILWKKKLLFKEIYNEDLHISVTELASNIKQNQRFVIVTDYKTLLAIDTKTTDKLEVELKDLPKSAFQLLANFFSLIMDRSSPITKKNFLIFFSSSVPTVLSFTLVAKVPDTELAFDVN